MPGKKLAWTVPGGLPLLAALVPDGVDVKVIDEAIEDIIFADLAEFDIIGVTGMIVQRDRMLEILQKLKTLPAKVVVGGPYASIDEAFFDGMCDAIFIGEADTTWPEFINSILAGEETNYRYEQKSATDMASLPPVRIDLLKHQHYVSASLQYSRGCPFTCEFCDIIVIFGRKPRVKTPKQVLEELDGIRLSGLKFCFIVDDNFIGNKVAVKELLSSIIAWQEKHNYPLILSTEVTLNLADDPVLLELMYRANFREVFIGIESPRAASLQETKKLQNLRGDSMSDKLDRIRDAGLVVSAGFIVGFDEDDEKIFKEQLKFIEKNHIGKASLGILMALPKTPLHSRLAAENRLIDDGHICNFEPKQLTRDKLVNGCDQLLKYLYSVDAFFGRVRQNVSISPSFIEKRAAIISKSSDQKGRLNQWLSVCVATLIMTYRLCRAVAAQKMFWKIMPSYARQYFLQNWSANSKKISLNTFLGLCVLHWHHFRLTESTMVKVNPSLNHFAAAPITTFEVGKSNKP